ncbi:death-associated protein-like 1 homolog isoform X2 [Phycodurus eques]|uniref:death-associated protein-like 1 homolog isoform X2 n=1 Tax=Phycodurus eques TaxID=693459 RepID=UPI002ACEB8F6|nr:death-associated protein-like 1 homolog isoform X2 [Phycodurus eques]
MVQQGSRSSPKDGRLLKAGHLPAVKAGGKRVAKKGLEEANTHGTLEKETKRSDRPRPVASANRMQQVGLLAGPLDKHWISLRQEPLLHREGFKCQAGL